MKTFSNEENRQERVKFHSFIPKSPFISLRGFFARGSGISKAFVGGCWDGGLTFQDNRLSGVIQIK